MISPTKYKCAKLTQEVLKSTSGKARKRKLSKEKVQDRCSILDHLKKELIMVLYVYTIRASPIWRLLNAH